MAVPAALCFARNVQAWDSKGRDVSRDRRTGNCERIRKSPPPLEREVAERGFQPAQITAGLIVGDRAKYTGLHCLRHFYASLCINTIEQGGLGLPPKVVQERLGHSSITMTYDHYGHLFPQEADADRLEAAEKALLA